nr:MMPL family transporter [Desulfobulbaceae bacterium]
FDSYPPIKDRRKTLEQVMSHLFMPMFYTSLTSSAGFASLALTPIPPVQAFGIYVAIGIVLAWLFTILVVPAYIMLMPEASLQGFGAAAHKSGDGHESLLSRFLVKAGQTTYTKAKGIALCTVIALLVSGYGISLIQINDNPVHWFTSKHPIRIADKVLNSHFGGTYEAFLVLEAEKVSLSTEQAAQQIRNSFAATAKQYDASPQALAKALTLITSAQQDSQTSVQLFDKVSDSVEYQLDTAADDSFEIWAEFLAGIDQLKNQDQIFKRPDVLDYIESLQKELLRSGVVGKSNSLTDVVKKIHQELFESNPERFRVPDTSNAVAQCLISFQNSHKPNDLWHLVTPDYRMTNIWVQLKKGDNQIMEQVVSQIEHFFQENPPPVPLTHNWAGLTYLNVEWQDKMVSGMRDSFFSSFVIVFIMMAFLFRSPLWGLLAMIPLTVTIVVIYGFIGLIGKDYDMPVAVLSSLALGLAVDFAIHFLERTKTTYAAKGNWPDTIQTMFEEPARAISRNVIVIAVGFIPLLAAPLVPYQTVGILLAIAISFASCCLIAFGVCSLSRKISRFAVLIPSSWAVTYATLLALVRLSTKNRSLSLTTDSSPCIAFLSASLNRDFLCILFQ